MADPNDGAVHQHADHVESVRLRLPAVAIDPDHCGSLQLFALPVVNRLYGATELRSATGFDLHERHRAIPLHDQIDIAVAIPKPSLDDAPPAPSEPPLRYPFPEFPQRLPGR